MARTFKDTQGDEWSLQLGLFTARRIRDLSDGKIDFVDTSRVQSGRNAMIEMAEDIGLTGRVLWWFCEAQAKERGISEEAFGDRFDMDVLDAAMIALQECIIDFFPSRGRDTLRAAVAIACDEAEKQQAILDQKAEEIQASPDFERMIRHATRGGMSGSSPDLRALDPLISSVSHPN